MVEQKVVTGGSRKSTVADTVPGASRKPQKLNEIDSRSEARLSLNNEEIDRITSETEFNTQPLLNGNLSRRV